MIAITRGISDALARCELTHQDRVPIDLERARKQHAVYESALRGAGYVVKSLPASPEFPDCVFVEDAAIVFDEIAVMTRPGAKSRRGELDAIAEVLAEYRALSSITEPGTLDGGDVLVLGKSVYVGLSTRSNANGVRQLGAVLEPLGYVVTGVEVRGCLHLKSAATALDERRALVNPAMIDVALLRGIECIEVDPEEPMAANLVALPMADEPGTVLHGAAYPRTGERLIGAGLNVVEVPADELAKAEGALSCCSILIH
ncbi:N(G),N(G)-dimethylarginine dimethylaminohydrolase [Planctomycetes bacterium Poly30]|uniref:N(G),N(G)-dimethylarginine dimethylaminohydrolase n=1 Tax=Saltatorellus ferox TaxID=2528018 RepID=A0A518EMM6_9BACT|nr:N(G),N(G)-dimethylarginine dimethylaminohydrolase [Planctomycetes bacterium Poly30]